jgi:hypothetical protein
MIFHLLLDALRFHLRQITLRAIHMAHNIYSRGQSAVQWQCSAAARDGSCAAWVLRAKGGLSASCVASCVGCVGCVRECRQPRLELDVFMQSFLQLRALLDDILDVLRVEGGELAINFRFNVIRALIREPKELKLTKIRTRGIWNHQYSTEQNRTSPHRQPYIYVWVR